jgi:ubiquinone/menaquinone biosynthesis C-methylase UbiE
MTEYIFSDNQEDNEYYRLRLLEEAFDKKTKTILHHAGLKEGWKCLEIGPGAGSILGWMAEIVGDSGIVVGLDKNTKYIKQLDHTPIKIVEGMIQDFKYDQQFDLIHARYVFIHNTNAAKLISKTTELLKPGGILVVEEPDFTVARWIDDRYEKGGNRVNQAICKMFQAKRLNPAYGTQVGLDMASSGLNINRIDSEMHLEFGGSRVAKVMSASTEALKEKYIETGECSEDDVGTYIKGAKDPRSFATYYATMSIVGIKT